VLYHCVTAGAATTYIFEVFFKCFTLAVWLGLYHGLVVLPVLLSLVGPSSYADRRFEGETLTSGPVAVAVTASVDKPTAASVPASTV
jgi:hypothetical protein